jgi:dethiobiotin synthetase
MTTFVLIAGTGTEIGKTYVGARIAAALRERGVAVFARKPVQSFAPDDNAPTDADLLAAATGEEPHAVCPEHRWLPRAMAPPMAADALGLPPFGIADLVAEITATAPHETVVLVESAGGVRSPLADDGDTVALAGALQPALVLLVAEADLGTINLVRLSADALAPHRVVVYLNHFDACAEVHARNRDWLVTRHGLEVVSDPEAVAAMLVRI